MRCRLAVACFALGCGGPAHGPREPSSDKELCSRAPAAVGERFGRALELRLQAASSAEEAALALLELGPGRPQGEALMREALAAEGVTRQELARCLAHEQAQESFRQRLGEHVASARLRARALPELSASEQGCRLLLPLLAAAKEEQGLPIALAARMALPCAGKVPERELRCAIAEGNLAHFSACQRGERDPPPPPPH